jgi:hypothetical protein
LGIKRRTSSTTKIVAVLSREAIQIHDRSPTQSEPQSHRVRLLASIALTIQLHLNYSPSKNLEPQIVRTQPKSCEASLSRQSNISMSECLLLPGRKVTTTFRAYRVLRIYKMKYQQLLELLGNRDNGSAQGPDPDGDRSSCCEVSQWLEENAGTRHGRRGAESTS